MYQLDWEEAGVSIDPYAPEIDSEKASLISPHGREVLERWQLSRPFELYSFMFGMERFAAAMCVRWSGRLIHPQEMQEMVDDEAAACSVNFISWRRLLHRLEPFVPAEGRQTGYSEDGYHKRSHLPLAWGGALSALVEAAVWAQLQGREIPLPDPMLASWAREEALYIVQGMCELAQMSLTTEAAACSYGVSLQIETNCHVFCLSAFSRLQPNIHGQVITMVEEAL